MIHSVLNTESPSVLSAAFCRRMLRLSGLTFQEKILRFRVERGGPLFSFPLWPPHPHHIPLTSNPWLCPQEEPKAGRDILSTKSHSLEEIVDPGLEPRFDPTLYFSQMLSP